jgi:hypothetical protein
MNEELLNVHVLKHSVYSKTHGIVTVKIEIESKDEISQILMKNFGSIALRCKDFHKARFVKTTEDGVRIYDR